MLTIHDLLKQASVKLKAKHINSAHLDAEVLLSQALKKPKEFLFAHPELKPNKEQTKKYWRSINRRLKYEPIAYIIGYKEFYGLNFLVNKDVLIPRPLTEQIIDQIKKLKKTTNEFTLLDIGTGSGCIAITVAKFFPKAKIIATDISNKALKVAQQNAHHHNVFKKITFIKSDLLKNPKLKKFLPTVDLISSNLPYIPLKKFQTLSKETTKYEPKQALIAKQKGWEYYDQLKKQLNEQPTKKKGLKTIIETPNETIATL